MLQSAPNAASRQVVAAIYARQRFYYTVAVFAVVFAKKLAADNADETDQTDKKFS